MAEETQVTLRYLGPDVDDGSIGVDDLLSALNGFSSAFYKVAERVDLDQQQRIKVTGISQSSANIHLAIIEFAQNNPKVAGAIGTALASGASYVGKKLTDLVIERISEVAKAKKHTQGGKYSVTQTGDGNRSVIINNLNVGLPISAEGLKLLLEGVIDPDLEKMTAPLREEAIEGFEMSHDESPEPDLSLTLSDRPYFTKPRRAKTETKSVVMIGSLTSINKRNNSGIFVSESGKKIRYKLTGVDSLPDLYRKFAHLGLVQVDCIAKLDENLDVLSIEISDIRPN